jgi:hypothetical protein
VLLRADEKNANKPPAADEEDTIVSSAYSLGGTAVVGRPPGGPGEGPV